MPDSVGGTGHALNDTPRSSHGVHELGDAFCFSVGTGGAASKDNVANVVDTRVRACFVNVFPMPGTVFLQEDAIDVAAG